LVEETAKAIDDRIQIFAFSRGRPEHRQARRATSRPGDRVVSSGDVLTPSRTGALAAIGRADVEVFAKPRVAILSTGNEIVEPGQSAGARPNFTTSTASAERDSCRRTAGIPSRHHPAEDTIEALVAALDTCAQATSSCFQWQLGRRARPSIVDAIASRGEMIFHGIAVKPGSRTAFALVKGTPFFRHAANPTSVPVERVHPASSVPARARSSAARTRRRTKSASLSGDASSRPPAATVLHRPLRDGARLPRRSRDPATSRACSQATAILKSRPIRNAVEKEPR